MQPYPRSPHLVWPGQLHGTGCLSAWAMDTGFLTVVWRLCLGPSCGWVWISVTPPALAGVLGGCVWVRFVVLSLFCRLGFALFAVGLGFWPAPHLSWLGLWDMRGCVCAPPAPRRSWFRCAVWACVLGSGLRPRPATPWKGVGVCVLVCPSRVVSCTAWLGVLCGGVWLVPRPCHSWLGRRGVCVFVRVPRLFPAFLGWGVLCGRACWARVSAVPRPSWLGCWGVFLSGGGRVVFWLCGVCRWLSWSLVSWSLTSHPLSFRLLCGGFFYFFFGPSMVCVRAFWVSLFPVGCCSWLGVADFGLVVPLCPFWGVLSSVPSGLGVWPLLSVLVGGLGAVGRSRVPPPSALPGLANALVCIHCGLPSCCWWLRSASPCPGPMGRVSYVHVGLGAYPAGFRFWLCRLGGCARGLRVALG